MVTGLIVVEAGGFRRWSLAVEPNRRPSQTIDLVSSADPDFKLNLCRPPHIPRRQARGGAALIAAILERGASYSACKESQGNVPAGAADGSGNLLVLALVALIVGAAAGLVGAVFRLALEQADRLRDALIGWAHGEHLEGFLIVVAACAAATLVAALLVRRFSPYASGSGIPHVEAVLNGDLPEAPFRIIPIKFVGGVLAIGAGLALGREGPSVQMGATMAHLIGKVFGRNWPDCRVLLAAGAGAGLATAFNAPIAGAIFVLEELVRRFEPRIAIAALGASATAIAVSRVLLGNAPDFHVEALNYAAAETRPLYFVLGALAGLMAVVYNRSLLATLAAAERLGRWPVELRAGLIGAAIGALAWFRPDLVGGGDVITQPLWPEPRRLRSFPLSSC